MTKKINPLNFEEALNELEGLIRSLESGQHPLEDAVSAYERGMFLQQHCQAHLEAAQMRVDKIMLARDGTATLVPLDD